MEILESVVQTAVIAAIQLGIPVAVLFIIGYRMYRSSQRELARTGRSHNAPDHGPLVVGNWRDAGGVSRKEMGHTCWTLKQCPSEVRAACPAFAHRDLPCWRAYKKSLGRLKAGCTDCELFLTVPRREDIAA